MFLDSLKYLVIFLILIFFCLRPSSCRRNDSTHRDQVITLRCRMTITIVNTSIVNNKFFYSILPVSHILNLLSHLPNFFVASFFNLVMHKYGTYLQELLNRRLVVYITREKKRHFLQIFMFHIDCSTLFVKIEQLTLLSNFNIMLGCKTQSILHTYQFHSSVQKYLLKSILPNSKIKNLP